MIGQLVWSAALAFALLFTGAGDAGNLGRHDDDEPSEGVDTGAIQVVLKPDSAPAAGARWRLDASPTLYASGATVDDVAVGTHVVHFAPAAGLQAPPDQTVVVNEERTTAIVGTYRVSTSAGAVRVTLAPAAAVTAGAKWLLDGSPTLRASGATVSNLSAGTHTIRFTAVAGYTRPANQTVTVVAGQTAAVTGTYAVAPVAVGSIRVTLSPAAAVTAGAKWLLDASTTPHASGATVASVPVGTHTVKFVNVAGYTAPATRTVTVVANQTTAVTSAYVVAPVAVGSVKVTLAPAAAVAAGAKWMLDSSTTTHVSGATVANVPAGSHTLRFAPVAGYVTPANRPLTVTANQTTAVTTTYTVAPSVGSLRVTLAPAAAVTAGAKWLLDASTTPHASGETVANLAVGTHTVRFAATAGYTTPANQTVTVAANQTAAATATYVATPSVGSLRVTLAPAAAVTAGARWLLDASTTPHASGETVANLAVGTHTVRFAATAGYTTPANQTVTIAANQTAAVTATYVATPSVGSLRVTLAPAAAVTAGARWLLDASTTPHASGETVANLAVGTHTVKFAAATGYATPANQTVTVTAGGTTNASATYTALISFATSVRPIAAASCSCHGTTMTDRAVLLASNRVVPRNAAASSYVTKSSMTSYWGTKLQLVIDWINQGANP